MRRSNTGLTVTLAFVAIALASLHIVYTVQSNRQILQGTFFASGILIMSGGAIYDTRLRLQSHGSMLHDFEEINTSSQVFSLTQVDSLLGSARFVTSQERDADWIKKNINVDRDIAFNYAYLSNAASKLSLYRVAASAGSQCFYLKELEAIRCVGAER